MTTLRSETTGRIFLGACLGMLLFGIALITLGAVALSLRDRLSLDDVAAGTLFSILPVGILTGSLLFGPISDRYGYKIVLVTACVLMFTGFQGIAGATSPEILKGCVFLFGAGGGAINGATNAVVADISANHKSANLSLLGVFFAIGALGMPFVLAFLEKSFSITTILSVTGLLPLLVAALYVATRFPSPKQDQGITKNRSVALLEEGTLIAIGFFLFCVSSLEAIINNWTTTYLGTLRGIPAGRGLLALSLYVGGMAVMRLLLGSVLRNVQIRKVLVFSFSILVAGCLLLQGASHDSWAIGGLVMIGAGLAFGFPVMLGLVSNLYPDRSATAFSIVLTIALIGNMLINLLMGMVAAEYGVEHLITVALALIATMILLAAAILRNTNIKHI